MTGIDRMIASALSMEIKKGLDLEILKKVERELFLEHGMSIKLSIEDFDKFSDVLQKNSTVNVKEFEKNCIDKIIKVRKIEDKFLITIINPKLKGIILGLSGDVETRKMISVLLKDENTIPQILKKSIIPKTSGYRKIENLMLHGIIIESRKVLSESKKVSKLQCVFQKISSDIAKDDITVIVTVNKKIFENSTSMNSIASLLFE